MRKNSHNQNWRHGRSGGRDNQCESHAPGGKMRGTPQQLMEKYTVLGQEKLSLRDFSAAENYFQHAEHYRRLSLAQKEDGAQRDDRRRFETRKNQEDRSRETADVESDEETKARSVRKPSEDTVIKENELPGYLKSSTSNPEELSDTSSSPANSPKRVARRAPQKRTGISRKKTSDQEDTPTTSED
jgi:hypothetical protein